MNNEAASLINKARSVIANAMSAVPKGDPLGCRAIRPPAAAAKAAKEQCGDYAVDSFRLGGNSGNPLHTEPPCMSSRYANPPETRGGPGENMIFVFPRQLCARGSMTLRRAKAAFVMGEEVRRPATPQSAAQTAPLTQGSLWAGAQCLPQHKPIIHYSFFTLHSSFRSPARQDE